MVRLTQNSFLGGQLDFEMLGRQDVQKYVKGATKLLNFNIQKRGGLEKRAGFDRVANLRTLLGIDASTKIRLVPFAYRKTQGFVLIIVPLRMYVLGTNPNSTYKLYNISGANGVYSSDEIDSIDYQQCGDVIFLAHQNHAPSKIEHIIDDVGEHGFYYEVMDFSKQKQGVPTITDAVVSRAAVSASGGTYTEEYKVSAVFDGVETFPCTAYKNTTVANNSASWHGTTYYLPWTDSQKITLTLQPQYRLAEDGVTREYPTQLKVYKKAFNYFGLIGVVKLDMNDKQSAIGFHDGEEADAEYENSDIAASTSIFDRDADNGIYGANRTSAKIDEALAISVSEWDFSDGVRRTVSWASNTWTIKDESGTTTIATVSGASTLTSLVFTDNGFQITATKVDAFNGGRIVIGLGAVYYTVGTGTVTLYYKGWTAQSVTVSFGSNETTYALPSSAGDRTSTITQNDGESDADFETRWRDAFAAFRNSITDPATFSAVLPTKDGNVVSLDFGTGKYIVANSIKIFRDATLSAVTFDDKYITPASDKTPPEYDEDSEVFSGAGNYPAAVSLTQQRLVWASSKNDPARIWMSQVGDFYTYYSHEVQTPDDAIDFIMPVTRFAKINHIAEMRKLLMFNSACEWLVDSASSTSGITYETIQAYPQSYSGSSERLKPVICNNSLVFCERTGQSVRRFAYDLSNDGFAGKDVSILSSSIFENNNIIDWTYQQFPFSTLWCVLADGTMASFEFMEEQDIMAWAVHSHGGCGKFKAIATSYAVAPALDEIRDVEAYENATQEEVFVVTAVGDEVWLERMRVHCKDSDSIYHALCMDSVRILNQQNPTMLDDANLKYVADDTVDGECLTREAAASAIAAGKTVYEGYRFQSEFVSVFPILPNYYGHGVGTGQIDIKNVGNVAVRLGPSVGGKIRSYNFGIDGLRDEAIRYDDNPAMDCKASFGDGRVVMKMCDCPNVKPEGMNTRDGRVKIWQDEPWPFRLLMYEIDIEPETGGWNGR